MYINGSGRDYYEFLIQLNRCGTLGKNANGDDSRKNPTVLLRELSARIASISHPLFQIMKYLIPSFIVFFFDLIFRFLFAFLEKLYVEHGDSAVQPIDRGRV